MRRLIKLSGTIIAAGALVLLGNVTPAQAAPGFTAHYGSANNVGCLDASSASRVYVHSCNSGDYQKWYVKYLPNGQRQLKNLHFNQCLDGNSSSIYLNNCNDANEYQQWDDQRAAGDSLVRWRNLRTNKCLTAPSSTNNKVTAKSCDFVRSQEWRNIG